MSLISTGGGTGGGLVAEQVQRWEDRTGGGVVEGQTAAALTTAVAAEAVAAGAAAGTAAAACTPGCRRWFRWPTLPCRTAHCLHIACTLERGRQRTNATRSPATAISRQGQLPQRNRPSFPAAAGSRCGELFCSCSFTSGKPTESPREAEQAEEHWNSD